MRCWSRSAVSAVLLALVCLLVVRPHRARRRAEQQREAERARLSDVASLDWRMARVGILTGGGDCPGLNAVIRAVTRRALDRGWDVAGVREGWRGLVDGIVEPLGRREVSGILPRGGTILGTTRTNPYKVEGGVEKVLANFEREELDALVAIGGEDTLGVAAKLHQEHDFPVVGVPKTIDNDLNGTDYTFGFDTAVTIATEAIDRLHTTAESHNRVMVVEVMGRHVGWIALHSGIAGGADVILIPEQPVTVEEACGLLEQRHETGQGLLDRRRQRGLRAHVCLRRASTLVAGEARATDQFGHVVLGGVGDALAPRDRGPHRLRDAGDRARPRPARRHADSSRPGARDALRAEGRRPRPGGPFRPDGCAAGRRDRRRLARGGDEGAEDAFRRSGTRSRRRSQATG